jgi:ADP-ribosylglycohydrolase
MTSAHDRARGCLYGLAIGDALGMPTQTFSRETISERYGALVADFADAPADSPIAAGLPAGSVTDDTEQALLLAELLVDGRGAVDVATWAQCLLAWERRMRQRGSLDLLGPSTRRALDALAAGGDPATTGRTGDTNGAAMRIAPVGILHRDVDQLIDAVVAVSAPTHGTGLALAAAAAVAAFVSAALDGADLSSSTSIALRAADRADGRGAWTAGARVAERIEQAIAIVAGRTVADAIGVIDRVVGTSLRANESVPAAFAALHAAGADPWLACRIGASVGGDSDTIAAIAGAMAGAASGLRGLPPTAVDRVRTVSGLQIEPVADALVALRRLS